MENDVFELDNNGLCNVDCCVSCLTTVVCIKEIAMYLGALQIQRLLEFQKESNQN
jgi:hypothetical protein